MSRSFDVAIIGAGAAGMFCAATAGARGRSVVLLDHVAVIGEKIRISGGGRCNFTNTGATPAQYLSRNPDFCRSALARYTPRDFVALVERHGIAYHEKKLGQLFCDESARQVVAMLRAECDEAGVEWRLPCAVRSVARRGDRYELATSDGELDTSSLVVATGGLTVPKIGATPFAYEVAAQFGLAVVPPRPALVPLALPPDVLAPLGELAGVSVDATASCGGARFRENVLFTHRGLSGPAILQASSYWDGRAPVVVDVLPGGDATAWLLDARGSTQRLDNLLAERLPRRFAQAWTALHDAQRPLRELGERRLRELADALHRWALRPSGTLGYAKAEVTLGGVDTAGLSSKTMGAKDVPGLHFIGECVDVTGWLGGYNFQWAWSSGYAAGQAV